MTDWFTALIFAVGFGTWVYAYMMRSTMRVSSSLAGAGVCAAVAFIVIFTLMRYILHF